MIKLYNTLSGRVEQIKPDGKKLYVYVCGITPYDSTHLGHARTFVSFDILRRWIEKGDGIEVVYIQNVTDIDDKIIKRASERKMAPLELSAKYDKMCREEMAQLNILPATHMPKISEHMPQTIDMIKKLMDRGIAYRTDTGIYYDISKFSQYGKLSRQNLEKIRSGARIEIDEDKKNAVDFALWKFEGQNCKHEPLAKTGVCRLCATSDSPWGRGRPGWHIECSAMSMHYTKGKPLGMHCGARDLIFPHHENEIAQSEGAGYVPFSKMWVHTGFLTVNGEKMAKSLGNFITLADALKKWDANTLRLFFALSHYRSPVDFSQAAIEGAKNTIENVKRNLAIMKGAGERNDAKASQELCNKIDMHIQKFCEYMDNDFDTPQAISQLILAAKEISGAKAASRISKANLENEIAKVKEKFEILGIMLDEKKTAGLSEAEVNKLVLQREEARENKDFAKADEIRDMLKQKGIVLEDSKDGIRWRYA